MTRFSWRNRRMPRHKTAPLDALLKGVRLTSRERYARVCVALDLLGTGPTGKPQEYEGIPLPQAKHLSGFDGVAWQPVESAGFIAWVQQTKEDGTPKRRWNVKLTEKGERVAKMASFALIEEVQATIDANSERRRPNTMRRPTFLSRKPMRRPTFLSRKPRTRTRRATGSSRRTPPSPSKSGNRSGSSTERTTSSPSAGRSWATSPSWTSKACRTRPSTAPTRTPTRRHRRGGNTSGCCGTSSTRSSSATLSSPGKAGRGSPPSGP